MSSWGHVLDLLDERYLNIQDVTGNVEPFPELVPYEEYKRTVLVYRIDEKLEFFIGRIQEFTDRTAVQTRKELWTWYIQWAVERPSEPANKRPRLTPLGIPQSGQPELLKKPFWKTCYRLLRPQIFKEPDLLRILIDIVQVESKIVPNYIEFLYQWIDFYLGDGKALKAAMRMEIPSLWLFEYHPRSMAENRPNSADTGEKSSKEGNPEKLQAAAEKIGERLSRKKPDIDALEAMTEESERLKYREPKFGIQPPLKPDDEPLPPLINIPRDEAKRQRYYAACFRNRQRALFLLQEAGLSARQVANYKKLQKEDPRETPEDADGDGFMNFYHDEPYAHTQFIAMEHFKKVREKQKEIAISSRLALEAQLAAATGPTLGGSSNGGIVPPPLIPPTLSYERRPDAQHILQRLAAMKKKKPLAFVPLVPRCVLEKVKSLLFHDSKPSNGFGPLNNPSQLDTWPWCAETPSDTSDNETEYSYYGDDIDPDERRSDHDGGDYDPDNDAGDQMEVAPGVHNPEPMPSLAQQGHTFAQLGQDALRVPHPNLPGEPIPHSDQQVAQLNEYAPSGQYTQPNEYRSPGQYVSPSQYSQPSGYAQPNGYAPSGQYAQSTGYSQPSQYNQPGQHSQPGQYAPPSQYSQPGQYGQHGQYTQSSQYAVQIGQHAPQTGQYTIHANQSAAQLGQQPAFRPGQLASTRPPHVAAYLQNAHGWQAMALIPLLNGGSQRTIQQRMIPSNMAQQGPGIAINIGPQISANGPSQPSISGIPPGAPTDQTTPCRVTIPQVVRLNPQPNPQMQNMSTGQPSHGIQPPVTNGPFPTSAPHSSVPLHPPASTSVPTPAMQGQSQNTSTSRAPRHWLMVPMSQLQATTQQMQATHGQHPMPLFYLPNRPQGYNHIQQPVQSVGAVATPGSSGSMNAGGSYGSGHSPFPQEAYPRAGNFSSMPAQGVMSTGLPAPSTPRQGLPHGLTTFPRPQFLSQSAARAAPPPSLNLQPSTLTQTQLGPGPSPVRMTPLANLANSLSQASPFRASPFAPDPDQIPILAYIPKILMHPDASPDDATDALLLGYTRPESGHYVFSRAIMLPLGVWENMMRRVRMERFKLVETYQAPANHPRYVAGKGLLRNPEDVRGPHKALYDKLATVYGFMTGCDDREEELTKRWRATRGAMKARNRGAVWEGWGVRVDHPVEMTREERKGAVKLGVKWIGEPEERDPDAERRKREIDELLEEDESWDMDNMEE